MKYRVEVPEILLEERIYPWAAFGGREGVLGFEGGGEAADSNKGDSPPAFPVSA